MNPEQHQASPGRSPDEAAMSWVSKEGLQGSELWNGERLQGVACRFGEKYRKEINSVTGCEFRSLSQLVLGFIRVVARFILVVY
nr:hypothetical protein [Tanacetum cinerariifolium]